MLSVLTLKAYPKNQSMAVLNLFVALVVTVVVLLRVDAQLKATVEGGIHMKEDTFRLPKSLCSSFGCMLYGGSKLVERQCECVCPRQKATFAFHNGSLKCLNITVHRSFQGNVTVSPRYISKREVAESRRGGHRTTKKPTTPKKRNVRGPRTTKKPTTPKKRNVRGPRTTKKPTTPKKRNVRGQGEEGKQRTSKITVSPIARTRAARSSRTSHLPTTTELPTRPLTQPAAKPTTEKRLTISATATQWRLTNTEIVGNYTAAVKRTKDTSGKATVVSASSVSAIQSGLIRPTTVTAESFGDSVVPTTQIAKDENGLFRREAQSTSIALSVAGAVVAIVILVVIIIKCRTKMRSVVLKHKNSTQKLREKENQSATSITMYDDAGYLEPADSTSRKQPNGQAQGPLYEVLEHFVPEAQSQDYAVLEDPDAIKPQPVYAALEEPGGSATNNPGFLTPGHYPLQSIPRYSALNTDKGDFTRGGAPMSFTATVHEYQPLTEVRSKQPQTVYQGIVKTTGEV